MTERLSQENVDLWASYDAGCRDGPGWSHNLLAREVRDWREIAAVLNEYFAGNCRRDHHGYCQEHLLEEECTVGRMRDLLAEIDAAAPGCTTLGCRDRRSRPSRW